MTEVHNIISIDPGTHKCGIALISSEGAVLRRSINARTDIIGVVAAWRAEHPGSFVVIGGSTQGKEIKQEIYSELGLEADVVDEAYTSEEARGLFWQENRPGCLWRIFPPSFRPLPRPIDDYAAVIIGRRFLSKTGPKDQELQ